MSVVSLLRSATLPPGDLFAMYFQYTKDTEAPKTYHRWSLLSCIGAMLGRQFWFPHGTTRIFPNSYVMLIGNPGTRKSSAIKLSRKLLAVSGYDFFSAEKTTKEKFLLDLEGLPENEFNSGDSYANRSNGRTGGRSPKSESITSEDVLRNLEITDNATSGDGHPREVFIVADEFNEFTGSGNLDFLSLLGSLWDWDDESASYKYRLKNSKSVSIYQPTISLLGGNTHTGLQEAFPAQSIGQGFMSRLLLIHGEPSGRKIAFPPKPPAELAEGICELLGRIKAEVRGEATITKAAKDALVMIYSSWQELEDFRFKYYSTRRFSHLMKLLLIVTAMRCSTNIDMQDVLMANTLLTHAEAGMSKALGEFGKSKNSEATQAVMTALYEAKKALTFEDLWKVVSRDLDKRDALTDILQGLMQSGKIQPPDSKKGVTGFLPLQRPMNRQALFVDFKLLEEMR